MSQINAGAKVFVKPTDGPNGNQNRISEDAAKRGPKVVINTYPGDLYDLGIGGVVTNTKIPGYMLETQSQHDARVSEKKRNEQRKAFANRSFTR